MTTKKRSAKRQAKTIETPSLIPTVVRARYDSVQNGTDNDRHWSWSDLLGPNAALSPEVRRIARSRARYEFLENSSYAFGIVSTVVGDTIGTGPRLMLKGGSERQNAEIQEMWQSWATLSGIQVKLQAMMIDEIVAGAGLARLYYDASLPHEIGLNLQELEIDHLQSPHYAEPNRRDYCDGIHLDRFGNPVAYDILKDHPGEAYLNIRTHEYTTLPRSEVIHVFRKVRPGQHHGISQVVSALPLCAYLRRFTLATVSAAEGAANVAMAIHSDLPLPSEYEDVAAEASIGSWMKEMQVTRNMAMFLPNGFRLSQIASEHPNSTYEMFKREIINEIARCLDVPSNVAMANSSLYNYTSGRMDHQVYQRSIAMRRNRVEKEILERVFSNWIYEAALAGAIPRRFANQVRAVADRFGVEGIACRIGHGWYWDGFEFVDPDKEASAVETSMRIGISHRAAEYAKRGMDMDTEDEIAARGFGLSVEEYRRGIGIQTMFNGNVNAFTPGVAEGQPGAAQTVPDESEDDSEDDDGEE